MKKRTIFKLVAISLPLVLLILLEVILRLSGYGIRYNLFNHLEFKNQPDHLIMNSKIGSKYFKQNDIDADNQVDVFLKTKTDSTFRIFVQGASTVVGFPYYHSGSFPRLLKHRLSQTFPEKNIEVINTGITAVNSYTLLDFTDEIIKQKPDVVIIYAGHNEYYGALGVGSTYSSGSHPALVRIYLMLKNLRLFQFLDNSFSRIFSSGRNPPKSNATLMEKMVKHQRIPFKSKMYNAGISQFESNMEKVLHKYTRIKIPVIISTLVCNEKDIKPFISNSIIDTVQFLSEIKQGNPKVFNKAEKNAMAAYMLGQHYLKENEDSAKKYLHRAKELDLLRFRAPEKMNRVIISLAKKYGCHMVNMKEVFLNYTEQKVIGDELLTEHIHPNIKGNFVMADAFYNKIKELNLLCCWDNYITYDEAYHDIPVALIDSLYGKFLIESMKQAWPFDLNKTGTYYKPSYFSHQKPGYEELKAGELLKNDASREDVMLESFKYYKSVDNYEQCLRIVQTDIYDNPFWIDLYYYAGDLCLEMGDLSKTTYYFSKFNQFEKSSFSARKLAEVYIKSNQMGKAIKTLKQANNDGIHDEALTRMLNDIKAQK